LYVRAHTKKQDCKINSEDQYKCANCGGKHPANSKECYAIKNASSIMQYLKSGKTFEEAKKMTLERIQVLPPTATVQEVHVLTSPAGQREELVNFPALTFPQPQGNGNSQVMPPSSVPAEPLNQQGENPLYSEITHCTQVLDREQTIGSSSSNKDNSSSSGSKAHYLATSSHYESYIRQQVTLIEKRLEHKLNGIVEKVIEDLGRVLEDQISKLQQGLVRFVTELLSTNLEGEGTEQRKLLLVSTIRNTLGSAISEPLLSKLIKEKKEKHNGQSSTFSANTVSTDEVSTEYETEQEGTNEVVVGRKGGRKKQTNNITKSSLRNSQKKGTQPRKENKKNAYPQ